VYVATVALSVGMTCVAVGKAHVGAVAVAAVVVAAVAVMERGTVADRVSGSAWNRGAGWGNKDHERHHNRETTPSIRFPPSFGTFVG